MKNFSIKALMLLGALSLFASCETDNDDNPVIAKPTEFVLNTPIFANQQVDLASDGLLTFVVSQPNFGFPLQMNYTLQYSLDGQFTVSVDEAEATEGTATYQEADQTSEDHICLTSASMAKGLQQIAKWTDGLVPATQKVYVRCKAVPNSKTPSDVAAYTIYSNVIEFNVTPVYVELSDAPVVMWYLVGNMFGGKWGSEVGVSALPMFIIPDYAYDKKTGLGEVEYLNYFETGEYDGNECGTAGFKIQPDNFNWDLGMTGDNGQKGTIIFRNKGSDGGHIVAPENGYYLITMNTEKKTATIEKQDISPATFEVVSMSGSFNDWADTDMQPYNTVGVENHVWYLSVDFAADQEVKFKQGGSWDNNWGASAFPVGMGTNNGANIAVPAGKWLVIFCDINGEYNFIAQ